MQALIEKLISIPSVSGEENEIATFLEGYLRDRLPSGSLRRIGHNLVLEIGPGEPTACGTLLLCSHIDTVQPCAGWTADPFVPRVEGEKIIGLGANDALASVVTMIAALESVGTRIRGRVVLALVCEEELGQEGFCKIEPQLTYDCGIFGEPTNFRIGYSMRGYMRVKLNYDGTACHASRPWEGDNPIFRLAHAIAKIEQLPLSDDSPWGGATVQPTVVRSGQSVNAIPDRAEATLDIRPTFAVNNARILELLTGAGVQYSIETNRREPKACPTDSPLVNAMRSVCPESELYGFGGTCDMAFATKPSVVFGPGRSERSHAADEFITLTELTDGKARYEAIILAACGGTVI